MREGVVYEAAFAGAERLPVCYSMDQAEAKGYASISKILSVGGSRIRAAKANNILMKQGTCDFSMKAKRACRNAKFRPLRV